MIVVLRITIGWHFFYEGLHKFHPRHDFSAKGFLGVAKGPTAELYYMMLPDFDGHKRLEITPKEDVAPFKYTEQVESFDSKTDKFVSKPAERTVDKLPTLPAYEKAWTAYKNQFEKKWKLTKSEQRRADSIFGQYIQSLREYAAEIETPVKQYAESLKRFDEKVAEKTDDSPHQRVWNWDDDMKYRAEADAWIKELDKMGDGLQSAFGRIISQELAGTTGQIVTDPEKTIIPNPFIKSQMRLLDLAVTYGLTAIGLCMILGFCNRLACLGGAAFLFNVWLSQFPFPGVYPELPDMIGHFLGVSKDFVEMIGCIMLATMPAGRWGGLDFFIWNCGGKQIAKRFGWNDDSI